MLGVATEVIKVHQAFVYNTRDMFQKGRFVVGILFINNGNAPVTIRDKWTIDPKDQKRVDIPDGTASADVFTVAFSSTDDVNELVIEETIGVCTV